MVPGPCDLTELRSEGAAAGGCGGVRFSCPDSGQPVTAEAERAQGFPQVRPTFLVSGAAPDVRHEDFGSEEASREAQPARKEARCLVSCSVGARRAGSTRSDSPRAEPGQLSLPRVQDASWSRGLEQPFTPRRLIAQVVPAISHQEHLSSDHQV